MPHKKIIVWDGPDDGSQYFESLVNELVEPEFFRREDPYNVGLILEREHYYSGLSQVVIEGLASFRKFILRDREIIHSLYHEELLTIPSEQLEFVRSYVKSELVRKACQASSEETK